MTIKTLFLQHSIELSLYDITVVRMFGLLGFWMCAGEFLFNKSSFGIAKSLNEKLCLDSFTDNRIALNSLTFFSYTTNYRFEGQKAAQCWFGICLPLHYNQQNENTIALRSHQSEKLVYMNHIFLFCKTKTTLLHAISLI